MRIVKAAAAAILFSAMGAGAASAAQIQSFDSGWYTNSGFTAGVNNINVGSSNLSGALYHNWLAFNLAGLAGQNVTGATLTFYGGNGVNTSSDSESLVLFDYAGSINNLLADSQFNVGIYTDLGDGKSYGTAQVAPGPRLCTAEFRPAMASCDRITENCAMLLARVITRSPASGMV